MKKEDIYKLIEYNGIYDDKIKKNLKNIIKKYHPDKNKKDKKTIEIIYEVKKELENNKISYKPKKEIKKKTNDFITEEECINNIIRLSDDSNKNDEKIKQMYDELAKKFDEYGNLYRKSFEKKDYICELQDKIKKLKKIEFFLKVTCILIMIVFCINLVFFDKIFFIIYLILIIFLILVIYYFNNKIKNINILKKEVNDEIKKINFDVVQIQKKIKCFSDDIHNLERKNNNVKNDIRFYRNMKDK